MSQQTAELFESGYAPKGVLRGRYAVPVKSRTGELLAYAGKIAPCASSYG